MKWQKKPYVIYRLCKVFLRMMLHIKKRSSANSPSSFYNRPATLGTHSFPEAAHFFMLYRTFPDIDFHARVTP